MENINQPFTIIPAIDIIDGKCVRLTKGDFGEKKIYSEQPHEIAKSFADAGFTRLHVVDLDGAKSGEIKNLKALESIARANLVVDFSGGIKSKEDVQNVLNAGASIIAIGSMAVNNPSCFKELISHFGKEKFWIGADVFEETIKVRGWLEDSGRNVFEFIEELNGLGLNDIFCTDITKDGMMLGPSVDLYKKILLQFPDLQLTASGGVNSIEDVRELKNINCSGVIVGKAIYENKISLQKLVNENQ